MKRRKLNFQLDSLLFSDELANTLLRGFLREAVGDVREGARRPRDHQAGARWGGVQALTLACWKAPPEFRSLIAYVEKDLYTTLCREEFNITVLAFQLVERLLCLFC